MGNTPLPPREPVTAADGVRGPVYRLHTVQRPDGVDLLEFTVHLYRAMPTRRDPFRDAVLRAIQSLAEAYGLHDIGPECDGVAWTDGAGAREHWMIPDGTEVRRKLRWLESLGHRLLAVDVGFAADRSPVLRLDPDEYDAWRDGTRGEPAPPRLYRRPAALRPSPVTPLWPLLACHRRVHGDAGLLWTTPMLYLMVRDRLPWLDPAAGGAPEVRPVPTPCGDPPPTPPVIGLCPGLPPGCDVRLVEWPAGTWARYQPLVDHIGALLCQRLTGGAVLGGRERRFGGRLDLYFGVHAEYDDLYVVVVGGVPVALMALQTGHTDNGDRYLSELCAARGSGAGALLVAHAQRVVVPPGASLTADALPGALPFYERCGFGARDVRMPTAVIWRRPAAT